MAFGKSLVLARIQPKDRMFKSMVRSNRPNRKAKTRLVTDEESKQEYLEHIAKHVQYHEDSDLFYLATKPYPHKVKAKRRAAGKVARRSRKMNRND